MTADSRGRELFIVDNSVSGWTGLRYLQDFDSLVFASAGEDELQVIAELIEVMEG